MPLPNSTVPGRPTFCLLLAILLAVAGCSGGDEADSDQPSRETREARPVARSRIIGKPTEAVYVEGIVTIQNGLEASNREELVAFESGTMLVAVKVEIDGEDQTLIPSDYSLTVGDAEAKPVGIAFGDSTSVFFDPDKFLSANVELTHGRAGQLGLADERLAAVELPSPQVIFLFNTKYGEKIDFWHGQTSHRLKLQDSAEWLVADVPMGVRLPGDSDGDDKQEVRVEVVEGQLVRRKLNDTETELYDLELRIISPSEGFDLQARDLYLQGGANRTRRFFFEFDEREMRMLAGSEYSETTYGDKRVRTINSGGVRLGLHGGTLPLHVIFPDPPFESGLILHLGTTEPIELIAADEALGEIRPAFVGGTIRVARGPIIGKAVRTGYLDGPIPFLAPDKRRETRQATPAAGMKFLALKFEALEGEHQFIPDDYRLVSDDESELKPRWVAVGRLPAERCDSDVYTPRTILRDDQDRTEIRKGVLYAWHSSVPDVLLIYEVPATASKFTFKHGETQLTIQPSSVPRSWNDLRPEGAKDTLQP